MSILADQISKDIPVNSNISLYWLGGAGYIIKAANLTIGLDIYLSDSCSNEKDDFKRLVPPPLAPEEIELDYLLATHEHGDHFDTESIDKIINKNTNTKLIGPGTVVKIAQELGIDKERLIKLDRNESIELGKMKIAGVFSDHGKHSPDAIGVIIEINQKSIYFTGDTCYRPDISQLVPIKMGIKLLIVPINGKFGNPDAKDASYIAAWVKPEIVIPCHFWMFKEHGGDPGDFVKYCREIAPLSKIIIPAIGERVTF